MMKKSDDITVEVHFAAKREDKRLMEMAAQGMLIYDDFGNKANALWVFRPSKTAK